MAPSLRMRVMRILIIFSIVSILLVLPFNIIYFNWREQINTTVSQMQLFYVSVLRNKDTQNNFFNIDVRKPEFYVSDKSPQLNILTKEKVELNKKINSFKQTNFIKNSQIINNINYIDSIYKLSNETFYEIVKLIRIRGFKDEGVIGNMRKNIHKIEKISNINMVTVLMLRRHEKDYMLRNEQGYIVKLNKLAINFEADIKKSNQPKPIKDSLLLWLNQYVTNFNQMVLLDKKIGLKNNGGLKLKLDSYYAQMGFGIQKLNEQASIQKQSFFIMLQVFYIIYFSLLIVISIITSIYLSRLVSKPFKILTRYISKFKKSNFNYSGNIEIKNSHSEVMYLKNEFDQLVNLVKTREHERDNAEKNIRHNEQKYREMADLLPQSIFETNINGDITYANKAWCKLFNYSYNDVKQGISISNILPLYKNIETIENGFDTQATNKSGVEFPVILYTGIICRNNIPDGIRGIVIDNTERFKYIKDIEEARTKAEQSDKIKSAFLANMSHEIRTPMNAIIGFSNLLSQKNIVESDKELYIQYIKVSGNQLLKLIDDIIDVARIEAGELKIQKDSCNIKSIMTELLAMHKQNPKVITNEIDLICDLNSIPNIIVKTDEFRLRQIINNLINNSIKFTHNGWVEFGCGLYNSTIQFYVKDTGIGIPADKQKNVFDRFNQIEYADKHYGGFGLGLTITRSLVNLLNGKIWLQSQQGKGTTFFFTIPYTKHNEAKVLPQSINLLNNNISNSLILIVEDNELNFILLREILLEYNVQIIRASNGHEAVQLFLMPNNIDLIIMDMAMPILNGYEACKLIRQKNISIPIIAVTANAMNIDRERCFEAGCNDYIPKPINKTDLIKSIEILLKEHKMPENVLSN